MGKHDKAEVLRADVRDDEFYKARIQTLESEIKNLKEICAEYRNEFSVFEDMISARDEKIKRKDATIEMLQKALINANLREVTL